MNYHDKIKKILIVSLFFAPDARVGGKRFSFLSSILQKNYPELHVLTLKEKYIPQKDHSVPSAGTIHRTGLHPAYPIKINNTFKRIWNRLWEDYLSLDPYDGWILPALIKGLRIIKGNKIDLVIATGPPASAWVTGYLLSLITKTTLILDYRDPWVNPNWTYRNIFRKKFRQLTERLSIRRARVLVFCSQTMTENFRNTFGTCTKATCHTIPNGFYARDNIQPLSLGNSRKNMVYAGSFYGERKLSLLAKPLFQLLAENAINKNNFCLHLFTNFSDEDRRVIDTYRLKDIVKVHPLESHDQMLRHLRAADILFLPSGSDVKYAIPFKFFDYLSVKSPIFAVAPEKSAVAVLMRKIDCGRLGLIDSEESILENLRIMILEEKKYSFSGAEKYTWDKVADKYVGVIDNV